jgi:hypothetical protein
MIHSRIKSINFFIEFKFNNFLSFFRSLSQRELNCKREYVIIIDEIKQKMKCYRKWWLFSRQRKRQRHIFIVILGLCTTSLLGLFLLNHVLSSDDIKIKYLISHESPSSSVSCYCSKSSLVTFNHGECFFDQPVCYPGFTGNQCEIQLKNEV